jgi:hypothetical protein
VEQPVWGVFENRQFGQMVNLPAHRRMAREGAFHAIPEPRREEMTVVRRVMTAVLVATFLSTLALGVAGAQQSLTCAGYAYYNKNVGQCVIRHEREGH